MIYKFNVPEDINKKLLTWITDKSELSTEALAGNIQEEYSLTKYMHLLEPFIFFELSKIEPLMNRCKNSLDEVLYPNAQTLTISSLWVNYQKKHEFNPMHCHSGVFSFIIFLKIPFLIEEEHLKSPGCNSNCNKSAGLSFFSLNSDQKGNIDETTLFVDKKWEKSGVFFNSDLNHCVYPFFSEGERITISGNLMYSNKDMIKK